MYCFNQFTAESISTRLRILKLKINHNLAILKKSTTRNCQQILPSISRRGNAYIRRRLSSNSRKTRYTAPTATIAPRSNKKQTKFPIALSHDIHTLTQSIRLETTPIAASRGNRFSRQFALIPPPLRIPYIHTRTHFPVYRSSTRAARARTRVTRRLAKLSIHIHTRTCIYIDMRAVCLFPSRIDCFPSQVGGYPVSSRATPETHNTRAHTEEFHFISERERRRWRRAAAAAAAEISPLNPQKVT